MVLNQLLKHLCQRAQRAPQANGSKRNVVKNTWPMLKSKTQKLVIVINFRGDLVIQSGRRLLTRVHRVVPRIMARIVGHLLDSQNGLVGWRQAGHDLHGRPR